MRQILLVVTAVLLFLVSASPWPAAARAAGRRAAAGTCRPQEHRADCCRLISRTTSRRGGQPAGPAKTRRAKRRSYAARDTRCTETTQWGYGGQLSRST
jgi:hypothetical protein